jgi:uncharacterized protein YuzE
LSPLVEFQLDTDVNALYIKLGSGVVSQTVALTDSVYVDIDTEGTPVGIEFTDADEFVSFLRNRADDDGLPPKVRELFRVVSA